MSMWEYNGDHVGYENIGNGDGCTMLAKTVLIMVMTTTFEWSYC